MKHENGELIINKREKINATGRTGTGKGV